MTKRLKDMILKRAEAMGIIYDIDGDIVRIFDKRYYVNLLNEEVVEV